MNIVGNTPSKRTRNFEPKYWPRSRLNWTSARSSLFAVHFLLFASFQPAVAYIPSSSSVLRSTYNSKFISDRHGSTCAQTGSRTPIASERQHITLNKFSRVRANLILATSQRNQDNIPSVVFQRIEREFQSSSSASMPRGVKKEHLPTKICVTCGRPFNWRKKWERVWDEVTTCSKSCNKKRREAQRNQNKNSEARLDDETLLMDASGIENGLDSLEISSDTNPPEVMETISIEDGDNESYESCAEGDDTSSISSLIESDEQIMNLIAQMDQENIAEDDPVARRKAERKAAKKAKKAERRAQREGRGDPTAGQKQCDMCSKSVNLLIRCTYDKSGEWKMVCGSCWKIASGGVVDGDAAHPHYRYGGLWKNRRAQK